MGSRPGMVSIRRSIRRTSRIQLIPVLFVAVLGMGVAKACYYQALNLENPADYYYRYCYAGCTAVKPNQPDYTACCTPLPAGTSPPATCAKLSKSHEAAGTTCKFGSVPTTDFPQNYNYAPTTSSGILAQPTQSGQVTVWVTSTSTTPCASTPQPTYSDAGPISTSYAASSSPVPSYAAPPTSSKSIPPPEECVCPPEGDTGAHPYKRTNPNDCVCTSSGMLAMPTSSSKAVPPPPPPPPPSSVGSSSAGYQQRSTSTSYYQNHTSSTSEYQQQPSYTPDNQPQLPSSSPAPQPPPPPAASSSVPPTSSSYHDYKPPCATDGLIYGTYGPGANNAGAAAPSGRTGDDNLRRDTAGCPHVGAAPSGSVSPENGRRALPTLALAQKRDGTHDAVVGFEPVGRALTDDLSRLNNVRARSERATETFEARERKHDAVIGFEPARRALTDDIGHLNNLAGRDDITAANKREVVITQTKTKTTTGAFTFYSCKDGWFTGTGVANAPIVTTSRALAIPTSSTNAGLVPTVSGGAGAAPPARREAPSYTYVTVEVPFYLTASCPWPEGHPPGQGASPSAGASGNYGSNGTQPGPTRLPTANGTCYCSTPQGGLVNHTSGGVGEAPSVVAGINMDVARREIHGRADVANLTVCPCTSPQVVTVIPPGQPGPSASVSSQNGLVANNHSTGVGNAPSGKVSSNNARRAVIPTITPAPIPRGYVIVKGGFVKRDIPPEDYNRPADNAKRNAPPVTVTSTSWITTDDCKPTPVPQPEEDCEDEEEEEGGHGHPGDYSLKYNSATSSGMRAMPASSSQAGLYDGKPNPSGNHVGDGSVPNGFVIDAPERRQG